MPGSLVRRPYRDERVWGSTIKGPRAIFSTYSRGERIADGLIHVLGVTAGCIGVAVLIAIALLRDSALLTLSLTLYGCGLLAMLTFSALYNTSAHPARRALLRRFDHAAIFIMIAGSYTPFALLKIGGALGWGLVGFVWLVAAGGAAIKLLRPHYLEGRTVAVCLLLGWTVVVAFGPLAAALPGWSLALLTAGGLLYSVGVVFHLWERLAFNKAIWHGFVLAGASCHYAAILGAVALPGTTA
ncbi:MAG: hemolysin III family protein [Rhodospirillales bacterium]|nr:hemolysin III family protein [Rhodospirillales bacterium]MDH3793104.1 hemolysin III family protein [Rhodospirillales bacterium]MDH3913318.1 hemolysin III family protein [Rhodospirillales bacterium]MDH3918763.1 hemolysin III family protein [Rhodospirillales bacterium]MDH3969618.1 hemolysin III family protein [Rhodospirillales bacterium]